MVAGALLSWDPQVFDKALGAYFLLYCHASSSSWLLWVDPLAVLVNDSCVLLGYFDLLLYDHGVEMEAQVVSGLGQTSQLLP